MFIANITYANHTAYGWKVCVFQASRSECLLENYFPYFSTKTYFVDTQNNRLNKTGLLSTQNTC